MKVLISKKTGIYYYYNDKLKQDFHCKEGFIKKEDLSGDVSTAKSNTNREFIVFNANKYDLTKKYKRGPQIITPKDLGYVLARAGINKNSFIVEAGGGSGAASIFFASFVKKVHTYEIKSDHCNIIKKNIEYMNIDNIELFNADLSEKIDDESNIDLLFLDMPEPCCVLENKLEGVKKGAYIVCYVPSISQIQEITKLISQRNDYYLEEISEVILRHWRVWEKVARPEHRKDIDHTAFLVFIRKV